MIEEIKKQYQYFYWKVLKKRPSFSLREEKFLLNFEKLLRKHYGESVGEEWLFNYILFQFNKFYTANTKMNIQVNWIFGKKSLQAWMNKNEEHHSYFDNKFKNKFNIKRGDLISPKDKPTLSGEYYKRERSRFDHDLYRKIIHCSELGLYDESSADCKFCKVKGYCLK